MKLRELETLLTKYQPLFDYITSFVEKYNIDIPLCGDVDLDLIDEKNYYGCNFTDEYKMCMLFFCGSSNYFPGIWIGDVDAYDVEIDTYPVYILDLQCAPHNSVNESCGNVKQYITEIIETFITSPNAKKMYVLKALQLQKDLSVLSDNEIEKGEYVLRYTEDNDPV